MQLYDKSLPTGIFVTVKTGENDLPIYLVSKQEVETYKTNHPKAEFCVFIKGQKVNVGFDKHPYFNDILLLVQKH